MIDKKKRNDLLSRAIGMGLLVLLGASNCFADPHESRSPAAVGATEVYSIQRSQNEDYQFRSHRQRSAPASSGAQRATPPPVAATPAASAEAASSQL
jgi:hypothetical protein